MIATKGIEPETGLRMSQVARECVGRDLRCLAVLSGPNFAREVARGDPTAGVLACDDLEEAKIAAGRISATVPSASTPTGTSWEWRWRVR